MNAAAVRAVGDTLGLSDSSQLRTVAASDAHTKDHAIDSRDTQCTNQIYANVSRGNLALCWCQGCKDNETKSNGFHACIQCQIMPRETTTPGALFCDWRCWIDARGSAPSIIELPMGHPKFITIAHQFKNQWKHANKAKCVVSHVYFILISSGNMDRYHAYRNEIDTKRKRHAGSNEHNLWHGTTRSCLIGDLGDSGLCPNAECALCSIIKNSFNVAFHDEKKAWGRFGRGIYTSATSSKSDSYSMNMKPSPLKAMLLNKVVVGRPKTLHQNAPKLKGPGRGYDSVIGEPGAGGRLNYDECVVYSNCAIIPQYLVIYRPT